MQTHLHYSNSARTSLLYTANADIHGHNETKKMEPRDFISVYLYI